MADVPPVVAGIRLVIGQCCRWPIEPNQAAMRRLPEPYPVPSTTVQRSH